MNELKEGKMDGKYGKLNKYGVAEGLVKRLEFHYFQNVALLIIFYFNTLQVK